MQLLCGDAANACSELQVRANEAKLLVEVALPLLLSGHAAAHDYVVMNVGLWHFEPEEYRRAPAL